MTRAVAVAFACLWAFSALAAEDKPRPRVAIMYFEIASNEADHQVLRKGLAEMLITDVSAAPGVTVVERGRIEEVLRELDLQKSARVDAATAQRAGKLLGAQYVVTGTLSWLKGSGRLDAHVVRVETGVTVGAKQELKDDLFDAETRLAEKLTAVLGTLDGRDVGAAPKKQGRLNLENAVRYSQALDALDKNDKKTAQEKLKAVVKAQPDFLLASLELDRLMK